MKSSWMRSILYLSLILKSLLIEGGLEMLEGKGIVEELSCVL